MDSLDEQRGGGLGLPSVELGELRVEPAQLVDDDAAQDRGRRGGVSVRHRDGHLRLLHQFVMADERPDQHLLRALVDHEVEALDELRGGGLDASSRDQPPARAAMRAGRQSAMPQWDRDGDVSRTKYRCWARGTARAFGSHRRPRWTA
jgi:hypothetical protein